MHLGQCCIDLDTRWGMHIGQMLTFGVSAFCLRARTTHDTAGELVTKMCEKQKNLCNTNKKALTLGTIHAWSITYKVKSKHASKQEMIDMPSQM